MTLNHYLKLFLKNKMTDQEEIFFCMECNCQLTRFSIFPSAASQVHGSPKGFCSACVKRRCKGCKIVMGNYHCSQKNCGTQHGKISVEDSTICRDCYHKKIRKKIRFNPTDLQWDVHTSDWSIDNSNWMREARRHNKIMMAKMTVNYFGDSKKR